MTKPGERVLAGWAVQSKVPDDHEDARVLACYGGAEYQDSYTSVLEDLNPGNAATERSGEQESLPYIVIGPTERVEDGGHERAVTLCEWTDDVDAFHRRISRTALYLIPSPAGDVGERSLRDLGEAVAGPGRPEPADWTEDQPVHLTIRRRSTPTRPWSVAGGEFEWLVWTAAALLERPVVIIGGVPSWQERLDVLDAVLALLPAGMRPAVSAATWTGANAPERIRLSFGLASGRNVHEIYWSRLPDPAQFARPVAELAEQVIALANRHGQARVRECFESATESVPLGTWESSVRAVREALRPLDLIRQTWQELRDGRGAPGSALSALVATPRDEVHPDDQGRADDLIDSVLRSGVEDDLRGLARLGHWESARSRAIKIIGKELTGAAPAGRTALSMWPVVVERGDADRFLAELVVIAIEDRTGTAARRLVDLWVAIADRIPPADLMPQTRARILKYEHFINVLFGLRDRPDPAGWIRRWLLWLDCSAPDSPSWLRAYLVLLIPPEDSDYARALGTLTEQSTERQLTVLLAACRSGLGVQIFPHVWPAAIAAADEVAGTSPQQPRHKPEMERLRNRLDSILAPSAYFDRAPMDVRSQVDTLRALLDMTPSLRIGGRPDAEYLPALAKVWHTREVVRHLPAVTAAFVRGAIGDHGPGGDGSINILKWLVLGVGRLEPAVTETVARLLTKNGQLLRGVIDESKLPNQWWNALFAFVPDLAAAVQLERVGAAAQRGRPPEQLAQLWVGAVDQGSVVRDVMRQLAPWAARAPSSEIERLLDAIPPEYQGLEILIFIAEGDWGRRVAQSVTDASVERIRAQLRELDRKMKILREDEKKLKAALKRGQKPQSQQREQPAAPPPPPRGGQMHALPETGSGPVQGPSVNHRSAAGPAGSSNGIGGAGGASEPGLLVSILKSPARLRPRRDDRGIPRGKQ